MLIRVYLLFIFLCVTLAVSSLVAFWLSSIHVKVDGEWQPVVPVTTWQCVGAFTAAMIGGCVGLRLYSKEWMRRERAKNADEARYVNDQIGLSR